MRGMAALCVCIIKYSNENTLAAQINNYGHLSKLAGSREQHSDDPGFDSVYISHGTVLECQIMRCLDNQSFDY